MSCFKGGGEDYLCNIPAHEDMKDSAEIEYLECFQEHDLDAPAETTDKNHTYSTVW